MPLTASARQYSTVFLLAAILAAPSRAQIAPVPIEGFQVESATLPGSQCSVNRLMVDPGSHRVITWTSNRDLRKFDPTNPFFFLISEIPGQGPMAPPVMIRTNARVEPLRWSADGARLLFRVDARGIGVLYPSTKRIEAAPPMNPLWQDVRIEAVANGDLDFHRRDATLDLLRRANANGTPRRALLTLGPNSSTLLALHWGNQFRLTGYQGMGRWDTGKNIAFTSAPLLLPGTRQLSQMGGQQAGRHFLPYALPILDRRLGSIVGRFGLTRIEPSNGREIDLERLFHQLIAVQDVVANGRTLFALVDLEREREIVRIRHGKITSWRLCEKLPLPLPLPIPADDTLPANTPVLRSDVRFGRSADSPFGTLYRPVRADGRLIVLFHGGPTIPYSLDAVPWGVREAAADGVSLLVVEYSGMQGGGPLLSERLPRLGVSAFREDVERVMRWVKRSPFDRRFLLVDSFGGIPGTLAARYHAPLFEHMFFRAPALTLHPAEEMLQNREGFARDKVSAESQREFEASIYGGAAGRKRFVADLRAEVAGLVPSPRLSFYFGRDDGASRPEDLPAAFRGSPSVKILPATHGALASLQQVKDDIAATMARPSPSAPARH